MTTSGDMAWDSAVVNVLKANGAVRSTDILHATVPFGLELHR